MACTLLWWATNASHELQHFCDKLELACRGLWRTCLSTLMTLLATMVWLWIQLPSSHLATDYFAMLDGSVYAEASKDCVSVGVWYTVYMLHISDWHITYNAPSRWLGFVVPFFRLRHVSTYGKRRHVTAASSIAFYQLAKSRSASSFISCFVLDLLMHDTGWACSQSVLRELLLIVGLGAYIQTCNGRTPCCVALLLYTAYTFQAATQPLLAPWCTCLRCQSPSETGTTTVYPNGVRLIQVILPELELKTRQTN